MDTRRLILFFIFSFSLVMLWDAWQKQHAKLNAPAQTAAQGAGRPAIPGTPAGPAGVPGQPVPAAAAGVPVPTVPLTAPAVSAPPAGASATTPASTAPAAFTKALVRTDVFTAEIVSEGGDLRYLEFAKHKSTLDKDKVHQKIEVEGYVPYEKGRGN